MNNPHCASHGHLLRLVIKSITGFMFLVITGAFAFAQQAPVQSMESSENIPAKIPTSDDVKGGGANAAGRGSEEIIELSPFQVSAEQDHGYAANSTLMGTRLRTDLKDIASSISAVTKDFMLDVGANDMEGLLGYTLGTEVGGVGGNFSGAAEVSGNRTDDFDAGNNGSTSATRVRGLGTADNTRDYFLTAIPMDGYAVERVEISRGPNSLLYGLGAPAGIINSNMATANLRSTKTNVSAQYGSYGTNRVTLDHNQVIIPGKLAVRANGLYKDTRYRIEDTFSRDKRAYAAVTYAPFRNTVIKGSVEVGKQEINQPRNAPPYDSFSYWWETGQQVYNPLTQEVTLLGTAQTNLAFNLTQFGDVAFRNMLVYPDPNSSVPLIDIPGSPVAMTTRADRSRINPSTGLPAEASLGNLTAGVNYRRNQIGRTDPSRPYYRWLTVTDPSIFDYFHHQLDGPNNLKTTQWQVVDVSVEQRFFKDKLGVEAAYHREKLDMSNFRNSTSQEYNIFIDPNLYLLNGELNPNFGRPLMAATGSLVQTDSDREAKRLTAYYELDLRKTGPAWLGRILGRHTFTGNYTDQKAYRFDRNGWPATMSPDYQYYHYGIGLPGGASGVESINSASRAIARVSYLGPSLLNAGTAVNAHIQPVTTSRLPSNSPIHYLTTQVPASGATSANPWVIRDFTILSSDGEDASSSARTAGTQRTLEKVKSMVLVANNRWFEGNVVTTFGWRRDEWDYYRSPTAVADPATGIAMLDDAHLPLLPSTSGAREDHSSYGVAVHLPQSIRKHLPWGMDLSLYAGGGNNFQVTAQRYDIHDRPIDPQSGTTKEYGVRVSLFKGKFEVRATHYESAAALAVDSNTSSTMSQINDRLEGLIETMWSPGGFYEQRWGANWATTIDTFTGVPISEELHQTYVAAKNSLEAWMQTPGAQEWFNTFRYTITTEANGNKVVDGRDNRANIVVNTTDSVSKGWEFEAVFNPTRNWQIAFNGGQQTAVRSNSSRAIIEVLGNVFDPLFKGPAGKVAYATLSDEFSGDELRYSLYQSALGTVYRGPARAKIMEGAIAPEVRAWRWNAVTRYSFLDGWLKGLTIGGSVRWEDKVAIGYPIIVTTDTGTGTADGIIDVNNPYYGPAQTTFDAFLRYSRKIGKKLKWTGQVSLKNIGIGNEIIPTFANPDGSYSSFRIREPQKWTISSSFDF